MSYVLFEDLLLTVCILFFLYEELLFSDWLDCCLRGNFYCNSLVNIFVPCGLSETEHMVDWHVIIIR